MEIFAAAPRHLEPLVGAELRALGATDVVETRGGARGVGSLEVAYRACLWLRTASRVLLVVGSFDAPDRDALHAGVTALPWPEHLAPGATLAVDCVASRPTPGLEHTSFAALVVKDGIVDAMRRASGSRPSVDRAAPDLQVSLHLDAGRATVRLDLSGESLHRRHYRAAGGGPAPLKEHVAAALLLLAEWPRRAREGAPFLDPLCGAGTLPVEAALLACDVAPNLGRERFGLHGWRGHDAALWSRLVAEAGERARAGLVRAPAIVGYDSDAAAVRRALECVERAGLRGRVHVERRALSAAAPVGDRPGLLLTNPPYGERLGEGQGLVPLYTQLGDLLKRRFAGWDAYILSGNRELARYVGLRAARRFVVYNGQIECRLLCYPVHDAAATATPAPAPPAAGAADDLAGADDAPPAIEAGDEDEDQATERSGAGVRAPSAAEGFANRLRKNLRHVGRWARRSGVTCYRVYDADLPEYSAAVDRYERWVVVQEYAAPATVDEAAARRRLRQMVSLVPEVLAVPPEDVFLKVRRRQRGGEQVQKLQGLGELRQVSEGGHRFLVNLADYLDTGLFLDHRPLRALIGELAAGRRFLNLFAYTGTATVHAARGGASATTSIDLSATYLDWAARNLALNGVHLGGRHALERADCRRWLDEQPAGARYELIFLDPPTFSTSKAMHGTLDVRRDHVELLRAATRLLAPGGVLLFSTNAQRFRLDAAALAESGLALEDITRETVPPDFARTPRVHRAWRVTRG